MIYEKTKRYIIPFTDVPSNRAEMPEISIEEREENFTEVETGFPETLSVKEAKRCLSCRRCLGCALCWAECKPEAIDFDLPDENLEMEFDDIIITAGQDNGFHPIADSLGFGRFPDVITDLQFERMLSPTGPTKGWVVSPLDGEIPTRLAIVQGDPQPSEAALCASLVLGVNESILALHKVENLEISLVSPRANTFNDRFGSGAGAITGLTILDTSPASIERKEEGGPLILTYELGGNRNQENFDLIVILTKPKIHPDLKALSKKLDKPIHSRLKESNVSALSR